MGDRGPRTRLAWLLALAAFAALLCAAPSGAASVRVVPTRIFVSEKYPAVHGALHSRSRFCSARRRLLVYRARRGADKLVGRGWSHRSGTWRVSLGEKLGRGHYYVIATGRVSHSLGIRCPRAHSKSIPVE
jgi:hypothetical protein